MALNLNFFSTFPVLHTPRILFREILLSDAYELYQMRCSVRVAQFISRDLMTDQTQAAELIDRTRNAYFNKTAIGWAGEMKSDRKIIGKCGFNSFDFNNHHAEIGGEMAVAYWGKKLAAEAVGAILEFGLYQIGLQTIEAKVSPHNKSAIAVLTNFGFEKEAHYKNRIFHNGMYSDMAVYTLIKGYEKI